MSFSSEIKSVLTQFGDDRFAYFPDASNFSEKPRLTAEGQSEESAFLASMVLNSCIPFMAARLPKNFIIYKEPMIPNSQLFIASHHEGFTGRQMDPKWLASLEKASKVYLFSLVHQWEEVKLSELPSSISTDLLLGTNEMDEESSSTETEPAQYVAFKREFSQNVSTNAYVISSLAERGSFFPLGFNRILITSLDNRAIYIVASKQDFEQLMRRIVFESGILQPKSLTNICLDYNRRNRPSNEDMKKLPLELIEKLG